MSLKIREARPEDRAEWLSLWKDYLAFYKVDLSSDVTDHTWNRILDPASRISMRVAELDGRLGGFAIHHFHESTWVKAPDCYLEDLFVHESLRGKGAGRALIDDLITLCRKEGWTRLYWHTGEDNAQARKLYDSYIESDGHVRYRIPLT